MIDEPQYRACLANKKVLLCSLENLIKAKKDNPRSCSKARMQKSACENRKTSRVNFLTGPDEGRLLTEK
jgi:hypothetical protein